MMRRGGTTWRSRLFGAGAGGEGEERKRIRGGTFFCYLACEGERNEDAKKKGREDVKERRLVEAEDENEKGKKKKKKHGTHYTRRAGR